MLELTLLLNTPDIWEELIISDSQYLFIPAKRLFPMLTIKHVICLGIIIQLYSFLQEQFCSVSLRHSLLHSPIVLHLIIEFEVAFCFFKVVRDPPFDRCRNVEVQEVIEKYAVVLSAEIFG